jgi:thiol-disulfide isomerase/thioredoxin
MLHPFRSTFFRLCAGLTMATTVTMAGGAPRQLPEFTHRGATDWLNSAPLTTAAARGHPVLVEVWAFGCSNCLASLPWMHAIAGRYRPRGLVIVGVHTPELADEYQPSAVRAAVGRLHIDYPVMIDADYSYWSALGNHYWPAFYLYDGRGQLIGTHFGELHVGEPRSEAFESLLASSLPDAAGLDH